MQILDLPYSVKTENLSLPRTGNQKFGGTPSIESCLCAPPVELLLLLSKNNFEAHMIRLLRPLLFVCLLVACSPSSEARFRTARETVAPPAVPSVATSAAMREAFLSYPRRCRVEVQKRLAGYGRFKSHAGGGWTVETAAALAGYVEDLGNLAYGWPSVSGSKTILWGIVTDNSICRMP